MDGLDVNIRNTHDFVREVDTVRITFTASFAHPSAKQIIYETNFIEHLSPHVKQVIDSAFDDYHMHVTLNTSSFSSIISDSSGALTATATATTTTSRELNESLGSTRRVMHEHHFQGHECAVCHSNYKLNEFVRTLPVCKHFFHKRCIDPWIKRNHTPTCPICRTHVSPPLLSPNNPLNHPHPPSRTSSSRTPSPTPECHSAGSPHPNPTEPSADP